MGGLDGGVCERVGATGRNRKERDEKVEGQEGGLGGGGCKRVAAWDRGGYGRTQDIRVATAGPTLLVSNGPNFDPCL